MQPCDRNWLQFEDGEYWTYILDLYVSNHHDLLIDFKFMSGKVKVCLVKLRWLQVFMELNPMSNTCVRDKAVSYLFAL